MKKTLLKAVSLILAVSMLCSCTTQENNGSSDVSNTPEASTTTTDSKAPDKSEPESDTSADDTASSKVESTTQSESGTTVTTPEDDSSVPSWKETEVNKTMYLTVICYSRVEAIEGSETVKLYDINDEVVIVATTDTGYSKLEDGTFIHNDYLSDTIVTIETTTTTESSFDEPSVPDSIPGLENYDYVSSGHLPLDAVLFPLLDEITDKKMTDEEKLDALYAYLLELYYAERVLLIPQSKQHIAEQLYALSLFEKGYGICYDYSAAYTFAAKALGFEAKMVYGLHRNVDVGFSEHTWVEIVIDGETYIFDPSVEILLRQDGYSYGRKRFMKTYEEIGYYYSF
ncbi:MAG: transglutaminase domain-containing protein [Ruminiclostridium sp.]|nr:transglutaminase domain-containing protein [Ruminiclostridium sp.]